jgi:hypothetical protein
MSKKKNPHIGSSFQSWLKEEGIQAEVNAAAIKAVVSFQLQRAMKEQGLTKAELARRLLTSRSQVDRILDPLNESVSLATLMKAAELVGRELKIELV